MESPTVLEYHQTALNDVLRCFYFLHISFYTEAQAKHHYRGSRAVTFMSYSRFSSFTRSDGSQYRKIE